MEATLDEREEDERRARKLRRSWAEVLGALLLAIAGTASTWCGYYASYWSGTQSAENSQASSLRTQANRAASLNDALLLIDVQLFVAWARANLSNDATSRDWYEEHFRPEFRAVFDAWAKTQTEPAAPSTPFVMAEYRNAAAERAAQLEAEAERAHQRASEANARSNLYTRSTVFFGLSLFFVALAQQFDKRKVRRGLVGLAAMVLLAGIVLLLPLARGLS